MLFPDGVHVAFAVRADTVRMEYSIIVVLWTDGSTLIAAEVEANLSLPFAFQIDFHVCDHIEWTDI